MGKSSICNLSFKSLKESRPQIYSKTVFIGSLESGTVYTSEPVYLKNCTDWKKKISDGVYYFKVNNIFNTAVSTQTLTSKKTITILFKFLFVIHSFFHLLFLSFSGLCWIWGTTETLLYWYERLKKAISETGCALRVLAHKANLAKSMTTLLQGNPISCGIYIA